MKLQCSVLAALLGAASAVDIMHYMTDTNCMGDPFVTCSNFPEGLNNCCPTPNRNSRAQSTLFVGLDSEPPVQQGITYIYTLGATNPFCGTSNNAGFGYTLCLSNPSPNSSTGANYARPVGKRTRRDEAETETCTNSIKPDLITIGGKVFNLNDESREEFYDLLEQGVSDHAAIPAHLFKHKNATLSA